MEIRVRQFGNADPEFEVPVWGDEPAAGGDDLVKTPAKLAKAALQMRGHTAFLTFASKCTQ
jgi:hypothetical protein